MVKLRPNNQEGFTYPELIVVMGIAAMLFGFITINFLGIQRKTSLDTTIAILISDLKSQQTKAMVGDTGGGINPTSHGIYFESDRYILFRGNSYSPADSGNFPISLEGNIQITNISSPDAVILFSTGSGEINNFVSGSNTIIFKNIAGSEQKTMIINKLGVITEVN